MNDQFSLQIADTKWNSLCSFKVNRSKVKGNRKPKHDTAFRLGRSVVNCEILDNSNSQSSKVKD